VTAVPSVRLRARAAQILVLFLISVLIAILLVAPQPSAALGWELLAVAAVSGMALIILARRAGHSPDQRVPLHRKVLASGLASCPSARGRSIHGGFH
jgi:hypothetical protein